MKSLRDVVETAMRMGYDLPAAGMIDDMVDALMQGIATEAGREHELSIELGQDKVYAEYRDVDGGTDVNTFGDAEHVVRFIADQLGLVLSDFGVKLQSDGSVSVWDRDGVATNLTIEQAMEHLERQLEELDKARRTTEYVVKIPEGAKIDLPHPEPGPVIVLPEIDIATNISLVPLDDGQHLVMITRGDKQAKIVTDDKHGVGELMDFFSTAEGDRASKWVQDFGQARRHDTVNEARRRKAVAEARLAEIELAERTADTDITLSIGDKHFSFRMSKSAADELARGIRPA